MNCLYIFLAIIIIVIASIIAEEYYKSRCRNCGTKMDRHFDPEEDAEVWQCPRCGRCYIIK